MATKKPLISIIVPAFNAETKIEQCIVSLLAQTWSNIEIFVVDDGSTDSTKECVRSFARKLKNVTLLEQKRQGPGAAKNLASKKAKGSILVFVDSDEYPRPEYVATLTKPIREKKAKTAIGAWYVAKPKSVWARSRFADSHALRKHALKSGVFRAIDKKFFVNLGGFDTTKGYSDDRIPNKEKRARVDSAVFDHDVDASLSELYSKRKWIGSSILSNPKPLKFKLKVLLGVIGLLLLITLLFVSMQLFWLLIVIALLPLLYKTIGKVLFYKDLRLFIAYPVYLVVINAGMIVGFISPVYKTK